MDINDIRILTTIISLLLFLGLVAHAWSRRARAAHQEASMLIFEPAPESAGHAPAPPSAREVKGGVR